VLSVLLVEDNAYTSAAMAQLIEVFGHRVDVAESVGAAREYINAGRYDLLISDIGLPDGTGLDVVRHWNVMQHAAPSIAITGYGMEEDMRRCLGRLRSPREDARRHRPTMRRVNACCSRGLLCDGNSFPRSCTMPGHVFCGFR